MLIYSTFLSNNLLLKLLLIDLIKIICLLISIAYYTLAERKIMAAIQRRKGPNVVGIYGLLQPLADGLKLLSKELLIPTTANSRIFLFAPFLILVLSLVSWAVIPFGISNTFLDESYEVELGYTPQRDTLFFKFLIDEMDLDLVMEYVREPVEIIFNFWLEDKHYLDKSNNLNFMDLSYDFYLMENSVSSVANINYGILFILAISSLNVYGIIIAGWSSNSKYAFLGALRSAAQMISYEVSIGLVILPVILLTGSLNFALIINQQSITGWFIFPLLPCAIIFFISMLAETNRTPFDLTEAEAELVAGYNTEYSSIIFAMFFLAEYSNMILMSTIFVALFLGGWLLPFEAFSFLPSAFIFSIKIVIICFLFVLVRATFPRYRYDQLMNIGWKIFLPISLAYLTFCAGLLLTFDSAILISEIK